MNNKEIKTHLQNIYQSYSIGDVVSKTHVAEFSKYMDPYINDYKERSGETVDIKIEKHKYGKITFRYMNANGEDATASMPKAVKYYKSGKLSVNIGALLLEAFREDISTQIKYYKDNLPRDKNKCSKCAVCDVLSKYTESETDHYPHSFKSIFNAFISNKDQSKIEVVRSENISRTIKSEKIRKEWFEFHNNNALYREICKTCHKEYTKKQNIS